MPYKGTLFLFSLNIVCIECWHCFGMQHITTYENTYFSRIVETDSIKDVLNYATDQETLVVFDLDNTLVCPKQEVGSVQWFDYIFKQKVSRGMNTEDALTEVLPLSFEVLNTVSLRPCEPETPGVIKALQQNNIVTLALTSRSECLAKRTHDQLHEAGINFSVANQFDQEVILNYARPALLNHGIIFCANNNKGTILLTILNFCHSNPKKIVFVDDKLEHLFEVEKACLTNKIVFVGIRYSKLDPIVAQFDPVRAEQELASLFGNRIPGTSLSV